MINKFFMEFIKSVFKFLVLGIYSLWFIKEDKNVVYFENVFIFYILFILFLKELIILFIRYNIGSLKLII